MRDSRDARGTRRRNASGTGDQTRSGTRHAQAYTCNTGMRSLPSQFQVPDPTSPHHPRTSDPSCPGPAAQLICYFSAGTYEPARAAADLSQRQVSWPDLEKAAAAAAAAAGLSVGAGGGAKPGPLYLQSMDPPFGEELWLSVDLDSTQQLLLEKVGLKDGGQGWGWQTGG